MRGFTLLELVLVLILVSIVSVFSFPKISNLVGYEEATISDQIINIVSATQRLAVANRRNVYIVVNSSAIQACYDASCNQPASTIGLGLLKLDAPVGSTFTSTVSSIMFDPMGRGNNINPVSITIGLRGVQIEPYTGFVKRTGS